MLQARWRSIPACDSFSANLKDDIIDLDAFVSCLEQCTEHFEKHEAHLNVTKKLMVGAKDRKICARRVLLLGYVEDNFSTFLARPCPGTIKSQLNQAFNTLSGFGQICGVEKLTEMAIQIGTLLWKLQIPDNSETANNFLEEELAPSKALSGDHRHTHTHTWGGRFSCGEGRAGGMRGVVVGFVTRQYRH